MTKEQKQKAIDLLHKNTDGWWNMLERIEPRLKEYFDGLCNDSSIDEGDEYDLHNGDELAGALKFLRILRTYPFDVDKVQDIIYKYEGEWVNDGRRWQHIKGGVKHPGTTGPQYYRLQPFQVFILAAMFGPQTWINTHVKADSRELLPTERMNEEGEILDYRRLCTEFTLYTPRKTAKTQLSAFIQFLFFMNGDQNAECYCCANAADQSKILFNRTKDLIHQLDPKEKRIRFTASQVNFKDGQFRTASLTALSAGGKTKDGLFAALCSADEYGSAGYVNGQSDMGKLVSVVESSMGPRREPMTFISTTAGIIKEGPFIDKLAAMRLDLLKELDDREGFEIGDRQMCLLLHPDDWERDEEILLTQHHIRRKVNPMLGIIVQHSFYDTEIAGARQNPEKMNEVVSKLFNVYQVANVAEWFKPDEIRAVQIDQRIDDCVEGDGWVVFAGLDFSKGDDLNGISYLAVNLTTGEFFGDMDSYISEETVNRSPIRELFRQWAEAGWLHIVPGQTFDPSWPVNRIIELHNKGINFVTFGYDPYNAKIVTNALSAWVFELGIQPKDIIIPVRQNYATYNSAVNEFDYMMKRADIDERGKAVPNPMIHLSMNPMWPWQFSNCVLQESPDGMGNRKPIKRSASDSCKVDNVQMLLTGLIGYDMSEGNVG